MPARYRNTFGSADFSTRAFRNRRHAAGRKLDLRIAPRLKHKSILIAKVQDEGGHGAYLYSAAETLGHQPHSTGRTVALGQGQYSSIFVIRRRPGLTWAPSVGWSAAPAILRSDSAVPLLVQIPYARAMVRVCREESFHQRQGYDLMLRGARRRRNRSAWHWKRLIRWWWPGARGVLVPRTRIRPIRVNPQRWKIKRFSNDELRQKFVDFTVPRRRNFQTTARCRPADALE